MKSKFEMILRRPFFYFSRGLRKLDHNLTLGLLGRIAKSSGGRRYDSSDRRLVLILENIGDTVRAVAVLNRLSEHDWVVCTRYNRAVMEMLGLKNIVVLNRDPGIIDFLKVMFRLRRIPFSAAIILDTTRAGDFGVLVSRLLKTGEIFSGFETGVKGDVHTTEILVDDSSVDILSLAKASIAKEIFFRGNERPRKEIDLRCGDAFRNYSDSVGVHIGGFGSVLYGISRQYPGGHTAGLIEMLLARGYRVVITGDSSDARDFRKFSGFLEKNERFVNLAGRLNLNELACLFKALKCYITPDNGTLHLAQAAGCKKIFAIVGPTNPDLVRGSNTEIIRMDLPCSPCLDFIIFPSKCVNAEKNACISTLQPGAVLDRVVAYMEKGA
jgi:hypothetical protein